MVVERQQLTEKIPIPERGLMVHDHDQDSPAKTKIRMTRLLLPYWRLLAIAKLANAHEFIERMPQGYDTGDW